MPTNPYEPPNGEGMRGRPTAMLLIAMALAVLLALFPPTRRAAKWSPDDAAYTLDRYMFGYIPRFQWVAGIGKCESPRVTTTVSIGQHAPATYTDYCWVVDWQWACFH